MSRFANDPFAYIFRRFANVSSHFTYVSYVVSPTFKVTSVTSYFSSTVNGLNPGVVLRRTVVGNGD